MLFHAIALTVLKDQSVVPNVCSGGKSPFWGRCAGGDLGVFCGAARGSPHVSLARKAPKGPQTSPQKTKGRTVAGSPFTSRSEHTPVRTRAVPTASASPS